ncbi:hypothetical protein JW859_04040 [bacterium]|nr:hypothetical protein [bacterium]
MLNRIAIFVACLLALLLVLAAAEKPPAEFLTVGRFDGGTATDNVALTAVRFGGHADYTRMVLDFATRQDNGTYVDANTHPVYSVEYREFPYRLVIKLQDVLFKPDLEVAAKPALPFSVVAREDGTIKEMQVFLEGPAAFKVIEIDDPAKLSIDVKPLNATVPTIYTVQLTGNYTATEAFSLVERSSFPAGYDPAVLVLGDLVVVEQVILDPQTASMLDAALREMGYASVINERRGNELPQR